MANIDIEKKSGASVWPWLLGLLLVVAVLTFIFWPRDDDKNELATLSNTEQRDGATDTYPTDEVAAGTNTMAQPVSSYVEWSNNMSKNEMGLAHEFTSNGLESMANALAAIAEKVPNVNQQQVNQKLIRMRKNAGTITENWKSTSHAAKIKQAFLASTDVFEALQQSSFPDLQSDVQEIRQAVNQMDTKTLTLNQKNKVKDVFRLSADVLQKMSQNRGS